MSLGLHAREMKKGAASLFYHPEVTGIGGGRAGLDVTAIPRSSGVDWAFPLPLYVRIAGKGGKGPPVSFSPCPCPGAAVRPHQTGEGEEGRPAPL